MRVARGATGEGVRARLSGKFNVIGIFMAPALGVGANSGTPAALRLSQIKLIEFEMRVGPPGADDGRRAPRRWI